MKIRITNYFRLTSGCLGVLFAATAMGQQPDTIFYNGKILTTDAEFSIVEAVSMSKGRFTSVGKSSDLLNQAGPNTGGDRPEQTAGKEPAKAQDEEFGREDDLAYRQSGLHEGQISQCPHEGRGGEAEADYKAPGTGFERGGGGHWCRWSEDGIRARAAMDSVAIAV